MRPYRLFLHAGGLNMDDGTYNQHRAPVTHAGGYQVGLWTRTTDAENIEAVIDEITSEWAGEWGVWTDSETGEIFVEPCVWVEGREDALQVGRSREQRTVWSWADMCEIKV